MPKQNGAAHRIMEIVLRSPDCPLEEVVLQCPDLTWNQVFLTVDRLSRSGEVQLMPKGPGVYTLHLPHPPTAFLPQGNDTEGREAR